MRGLCHRLGTLVATLTILISMSGQELNRAGRAGMAARELWPTEYAREHQVSPDGHSIAFIDDRTGDLCLRDVESGVVRNLTQKGSFHVSDAAAGHPLFSPDSKLIAFRWYDGKKTTELRMIRTDGTEIRSLVASSYDPVAFSPDGKKLLIVSYQPNGLPDEYRLLSLLTGVHELLFAQRDVRGGLAFSPRGDRIVFSLRVGPKDTDRRLMLARADGSDARPVLQETGNHRYPVWSPDGTQIVFRSNRSGTNGIWSIPVGGGNPRLLRRDVGDVALLGFDAQKTLYYSQRITESDVYVARIDTLSGQILESPKLLVTSFVSRNRHPSVSPDGQWLAWYSNRNPDDAIQVQNSVVVRRIDGGEEYIMPLRQPAAVNMVSPRWFPDSKALLLGTHPTQKNEDMVVERVEVPSGQRRVIYRGKMDNVTQWTMVALPEERLRWCRCKPNVLPSQCEVITFDIRSGTESREPIPYTHRNYPGPSLSPDGQWLAHIYRRQGGRGDDWDLEVRPAGKPFSDGGLVLARSEAGAWIRRKAGLSWSADGKCLLFAVASGGEEDSNGKMRIQMIAKDGRRPVIRIDLDARYPSLLADGRLVFSYFVPEREELWEMRNLPGI